MAAQLPEAEATLAMAPPAEPAVRPRGWTRNLDLVIPSAMIGVILFLCFVWPLFGSVPKPTGGNILDANVPSFSSGHFLGTDQVGNDLWARLLYGGRNSLEIAFAVNLIGLVLGGTLGAFAAFWGSFVDTVTMRVLDVLIAFPSLVLALAIAQSLGASKLHTIYALSFFSVPAFARLSRAGTLRLRERPFMLAARLAGTRAPRILLRHVAPNILGTGKFVAIGESLPYMPAPWDKTALVSRVDAIANIMKIVEVAQQHGVAARIHTGIPYGYTAAYSYGPIGPANVNPLWMLDIAAAFPDVTLIFDHGGIQAGWWERFYEECLTVIAANDNVYVETGLWWRELYEKPLMDPNIGPAKLLWGTDWGASMQIYSQPGRYPPSYAVQLRGEGIPHYQVDYWGWSLRELTSVRISQDDMNLILGANAARIFDLDVPHTRLFKPPSDQVGRKR